MNGRANKARIPLFPGSRRPKQILLAMIGAHLVGGMACFLACLLMLLDVHSEYPFVLALVIVLIIFTVGCAFLGKQAEHTARWLSWRIPPLTAKVIGFVIGFLLIWTYASMVAFISMVFMLRTGLCR